MRSTDAHIIFLKYHVSLFLNLASQFEQNVENGVNNLPESFSGVYIYVHVIVVLLE